MWEVGGYILVRHQSVNPMCQSLCFQDETLERFQINKDKDEEITLRQHGHIGDVHLQSGAWRRFSDEDEMNAEVETNAEDEDDDGDDEFLDQLDKSYHGLGEGDQALHDSLDAEADLDNFDFLPPLNGIVGSSDETPRTDGLNNRYVRIVHVNGIHHLALVTCSCRGHDNVPLDLMFTRLVPTSFVRFRTLFTVAVLDHFRLSNLELKASGYQYFNFLRRLTMPSAPSQVINFYHELRRLSRLWRWMKRIKWAGYGHSSQSPTVPSQENLTEPSKRDPMEPSQGELAVFCPACPQPGINLPRNWKEDEER